MFYLISTASATSLLGPTISSTNKRRDASARCQCLHIGLIFSHEKLQLPKYIRTVDVRVSRALKWHLIRRLFPNAEQIPAILSVTLLLDIRLDCITYIRVGVLYFTYTCDKKPRLKKQQDVLCVPPHPSICTSLRTTCSITVPLSVSD